MKPGMDLDIWHRDGRCGHIWSTKSSIVQSRQLWAAFGPRGNLRCPRKASPGLLVELSDRTQYEGIRKMEDGLMQWYLSPFIYPLLLLYSPCSLPQRLPGGGGGGKSADRGWRAQSAAEVSSIQTPMRAWAAQNASFRTWSKDVVNTRSIPMR